ncbi:MAG: hypothetical protein LBE83_01490 [Propionibacteriaceae bacterium]|jgi:hypothetical protein|nr:hypothetical protein [Propionibacteriaceae bacterium]
MAEMTVTRGSIATDCLTFMGWEHALEDDWKTHLNALSLSRKDCGTYTGNMIQFYAGYIQAVQQMNRYVLGDDVGENGKGGKAAFDAFVLALNSSALAYQDAVDSVYGCLNNLEEV